MSRQKSSDEKIEVQLLLPLPLFGIEVSQPVGRRGPPYGRSRAGDDAKARLGPAFDVTDEKPV